MGMLNQREEKKRHVGVGSAGETEAGLSGEVRYFMVLWCVVHILSEAVSCSAPTCGGAPRLKSAPLMYVRGVIQVLGYLHQRVPRSTWYSTRLA